MKRETAIIDGIKHWRCSGACGRMLPIGMFHLRASGEPLSLCKPCHRKYCQERSEKKKLEVEHG